MKKRIKYNHSLYSKLCVYFSMLIIIVTSLNVGIIYFGSYYNFNHIFEDRIIEYHNNNDNIVKDEWILGVTANSIDLVEAVHGKETADRILEQAKKQIANSKLYKEKVDGKYIMYMIDIDEKNGEKVYKYSIIKDIYRDIFPKIILCLFLGILIIFIFSFKFIKIICQKITTGINDISSYADKIAKKDWDKPISIDSDDADIKRLGDVFEDMRKQLYEKDLLQQSMLQYISHELKTPIMIIGSYSQAAKENIYPAGDVNSTLDIILEQTDRIEKKVADLLILTKLESSPDTSKLKYESIGSILYDVLNNFKAFFISNPNIKILCNIDENVYSYVYEDELKVAFENIIDNRTRYAVSLISIRVFESNSNINIIFYNDGKKLDLDNYNNIFKPFEKGENGKSGLGMSICHKIIQLHNGSIKHIPTSKGCIFKISLPKENI